MVMSIASDFSISYKMTSDGRIRIPRVYQNKGCFFDALVSIDGVDLNRRFPSTIDPMIRMLAQGCFKTMIAQAGVSEERVGFVVQRYSDRTDSFGVVAPEKQTALEVIKECNGNYGTIKSRQDTKALPFDAGECTDADLPKNVDEGLRELLDAFTTNSFRRLDPTACVSVTPSSLTEPVVTKPAPHTKKSRPRLLSQTDMEKVHWWTQKQSLLGAFNEWQQSQKPGRFNFWHRTTIWETMTFDQFIAPELIDNERERAIVLQALETPGPEVTSLWNRIRQKGPDFYDEIMQTLVTRAANDPDERDFLNGEIQTMKTCAKNGDETPREPTPLEKQGWSDGMLYLFFDRHILPEDPPVERQQGWLGGIISMFRDNGIH